MVYFHDGKLQIRSMQQNDIQGIINSFEEQKWFKPFDVLNNYYIDQEKGLKKIIVAEMDGNILGYVTLLPSSKEGPFANMGIPEIVDLIVFTKYQNQGIGNKIMDVAEKIAQENNSCISLSVGLHSGYGSAQRMYIKRGYVPDGSGVWYQNKQVEPYANCNNNDDLTLYLLKKF